MATVTQFTSKEEMQEQASLWISRMDRGLTADEHIVFSAWVNQSEKHREVLFGLAALWDDLTVLNELSALFPLDTNPVNKQPSIYPKFAMAATILFALVMGTSVLFNFSSIQGTNSEANVVNVKRFETPVGMQKIFSMPDGTSIQLNTNSIVEANFTPGKRQLTLVKGEARFDVAPDKNRPFTVTAGEKSFTALGTVFNVQKVSEKDMELLVTEGRVLITKSSEVIDKITDDSGLKEAKNLPGIIVVSGQKAVIEEAQALPLKKMTEDEVQKELAWRQGMLIFDGEPLSEALLEVSRYTPYEFAIEDSNIADLKVAGYFKAGDVDGLLRSLNSNFDISYQSTTEHTIHLKSASL